MWTMLVADMMVKFKMLLVVLIAAGILGGMGSTGVQAADPKLDAAYRRSYFDQQYPPEAVREIKDKLQNAPSAVDVLVKLAKDPRAEIRTLVAVLLGELGEVESAKALWSLLQDEAESVRLAASGALVQLRNLIVIPTDPSVIKVQRPEVRRMGVATLGRVGDKSVESLLIGCLDDENELVRAETVVALSKMKSKAIEQALLRRLQDQSVDVRWVTARALGGYVGTESDPEVISGLETLLKDPDWHVRASAIMSLGGGAIPVVKQEKLASAIVEVLGSDDFALVRDRAADVLAFAKTDKVAEALVQALTSDNRSVRFHAARAMRNGRTVAVLPLLMKHCKNPDSEVRERIMDVFGAIGGPDQLSAVSEAVNDPDSKVRLAAVAAFQELIKRGSGGSLVKKLEDEDPHVRAAAVRAIGQTGDKSAVSKLIPLLRDMDSYVRSAVAEALGKLGDRSAVPALVGLLSGEGLSGRDVEGLLISATNDLVAAKLKLTEVEQRGRAALALGELRAVEAVDSLIKYGLKSPDAELRATSAYSLGQIGDRRAVEPLQDTVRTYYATVPTDLESGPIIDDGRAVVPDNVRKNREKEVRVRGAVVWALGQIGDSAARALLARAVGDQNSIVRDFAVEALAKIAEQEERAKRQVEQTKAQ